MSAVISANMYSPPQAFSQAIQPRFGNRRDGAKNPSPREANREIWENHKDDFKRLRDEEGLYVWQVRASYHYISVRVEATSKRFGLLNPSKESVKQRLEQILGDKYGDIMVNIEKAQRGPLTKLGEGCCGNQCAGCFNGDPEKRIFLQG